MTRATVWLRLSRGGVRRDPKKQSMSKGLVRTLASGSGAREFERMTS